MDRRPALGQRGGQDAGQFLVGADREDAMAGERLEQGGLTAHVGVDGGELGTDDAAADDRHPPRQIVAVRGVVGGDDPLPVDVEAGEGPRDRAGGQNNAPGAPQDGAVDGHATVRGEAPPAVDDSDLALLEQTRESPDQTVDDALFPGVDRRPVGPESRFRVGNDAEGGGVVDGAVHLRRLEQRLGRDAASVQAGASHGVCFHHRDVESGGRGIERSGVTAGPAAEYNDVVFAAHVVATRRRASTTSGVWGTTASSSGPLAGFGTSFDPMRTTGRSRYQKHSSVIVAAISAP